MQGNGFSVSTWNGRISLVFKELGLYGFAYSRKNQPGCFKGFLYL